MVEFSKEEYADIIFIYGFCDGNATEACREYNRRFPNRRQPSDKVFTRSFQRLRENGISDKRTGGQPVQHNIAVEAEIVNCALDEPGVSTRRISTRLGVSQNFVWRTLNREVLHPFHYLSVQDLHPGDQVLRLTFCLWILQMQQQNENFVRTIMWTDEATFTRDGINNTHNNHFWSLENPRVMRRRKFQQRFSVNVWGGIFNNQLLPIQFLPNRLNANGYLNLLQNYITFLLEDIPLALANRMYYQHDGAPPHIGREVIAWLNTNFNGRWIGRNGPIAWPPRSPDLNPLDFFLWGHMKQLVYAEPIDTLEQLTERIINAALRIQNEQAFENVQHSLIRRCQACIQANGGHFEQTLH